MTAQTQSFEPEETVPTSGIYEVMHDKLDSEHHAHPHRVTMLSGATFPPCRGCGRGVRYRLCEAAEHIEEHHLFSTGKQ